MCQTPCVDEAIVGFSASVTSGPVQTGQPTTVLVTVTAGTNLSIHVDWGDGSNDTDSPTGVGGFSKLFNN